MRKLHKFIQNMQPTKIWVVGDIMLDEYYNVKISRISPEFPTQVMLSGSEEPFIIKPGGAANVCYQMTHFPVDVTLFSPTDKKTSQIFKKLPFKHETISYNASHLIPRKKRFYDGNYALPRWDVELPHYGNEDKHEIPNAIFSKFKEALEQDKPDLVILSDYGKGVFNSKIAQKYISLCNKNNIKTIVDPKNTLDGWNGCTVFKPNQKEALSLTNTKNDQTAICKMRDRLECDSVIMTKGKAFPLYTDNKEWNIQTVQDTETKYDNIIEKPRSVIGAGDCFVAMFSIAVANGMSYYDAATVAYECGIRYVKNKQNQPLRMSNLTGNKFVEVSELKDILECHKKHKKQIVFTNGCFDLIHPGHVHLLKEAKKQGTILVLGLNSDDSIKALKGENRPIHILEDRIQILSEFECVDYITVFDQETPKELIKKLKHIDVLVKGGDYKVDTIVGSDIVAKTHVVEYIHNKSTTNIINKFK